MAVLREQLGVDDLGLVFRDLTPQPVASASIGQVKPHRGTTLEATTPANVNLQEPCEAAAPCATPVWGPCGGGRARRALTLWRTSSSFPFSFFSSSSFSFSFSSSSR